jgi:hypothetical protein
MRSLFDDDVFPHGGRQRTGWPTPLLWPTTYSHMLRRQGLPIGRRLVLSRQQATVFVGGRKLPRVSLSVRNFVLSGSCS